MFGYGSLQYSSRGCTDAGAELLRLQLQTARATPSARWARPCRKHTSTRIAAHLSEAGIGSGHTKPGGAAQPAAMRPTAPLPTPQATRPSPAQPPWAAHPLLRPLPRATSVLQPSPPAGSARHPSAIGLLADDEHPGMPVEKSLRTAKGEEQSNKRLRWDWDSTPACADSPRSPSA